MLENGLKKKFSVTSYDNPIFIPSIFERISANFSMIFFLIKMLIDTKNTQPQYPV